MLLRDDPATAFTHFDRAARYFDPFDPAIACDLRLTVEDELCRHGLRTGSDGMHFSEVLLRRNLDYLSKDTDPDRWGRTQNVLAAALQEQGKRQGGEAGVVLLAEAVTAYRSALEVHTREAHPVDWAMTQENLANAFQAWADLEPERAAPHLATALDHVEASLEVYDPEHMPYNYDNASKLRDDIRAQLDALP